MEQKPQQPPTPSHDNPSPGPPAARLQRFIGRLAAALGRLHDAGPACVIDPETLHNLLSSLRVVEAALRYDALRAQHDVPRQIAVLGPTQTGKSTVVNLLVGQPASQVSPLAGFTVHPHGFCIAPADADAPWSAALFPGWSRRDGAQLSRTERAAFSLSAVAPIAAESLFETDNGSLSDCVIWDTPDFDSLAARQYERGVFEVAALADAYVLVLSREKYSDLSVWRLLAMLEPLRRPLAICLNKLTPESEQPVIGSLRERLTQRGAAWGDVPIVPLSQDPLIAAGRWRQRAGELQPLRAALSVRLAGTARRRARGTRAFMRRYWDDWLTPARIEHETLEKWHALIDAAAAQFLESYKRDYLDHPQRYDAFRRAALELLSLLELPRVGALITHARRIVTWPARQLFAAGQAWWRARRHPAHTVHSLGVEAGVLLNALEVLLTGLQRDVARRCTRGEPGMAVWLALEQKLCAEQSRVRVSFEAVIQAHHQQVQREIREAAGELYRALQAQPARLNALRTARVTIDAGALLLALKTGGLSAIDAVWAPAAFALSSLLIEGAAELEMGRVARRLKQRQWLAVKQDIVEGRLLEQLRSVAAELDAPGLLGLSATEVAEAQADLAAWEGDDE